MVPRRGQRPATPYPACHQCGQRRGRLLQQRGSIQPVGESLFQRKRDVLHQPDLVEQRVRLQLLRDGAGPRISAHDPLGQRPQRRDLDQRGVERVCARGGWLWLGYDLCQFVYQPTRHPTQYLETQLWQHRRALWQRLSLYQLPDPGIWRSDDQSAGGPDAQWHPRGDIGFGRAGT